MYRPVYVRQVQVPVREHVLSNSKDCAKRPLTPGSDKGNSDPKPWQLINNSETSSSLESNSCSWPESSHFWPSSLLLLVQLVAKWPYSQH